MLTTCSVDMCAAPMPRGIRVPVSKQHRRFGWIGSVLAVLVTTVIPQGTAVASPPPLARVSGSTAATPASWPMAGHDLGNTRNNPDETAIGTGNVAALKQKWAL